MRDTATIERARTADFLALAALDGRVWPGGDAVVADGEHTWRLWCEYADVWVARDRSPDAEAEAEAPTRAATSDRPGQIVGALLCFPGRGELDLLHKIFIDPARRGRGLGSRLMECFAQQATRPALLTVDPANAAARRVYERFGFRVQRETPDYYGPGEDRLVMVRQPSAP